MISEIYNQIPVELSDQIASINSDTQPNSYLNHSMIYNFELLKRTYIKGSIVRNLALRGT